MSGEALTAEAKSAPPLIEKPILAVRNLETHLVPKINERAIRAVDGVSFDLPRGGVLGIVGESGSGKSMTALSILRLLPRSGRVVNGAIEFEGEDLVAATEARMRCLRGPRLSMILQDPMASLDPLFPIGRQIAEPMRIHLALGADEARARTIDLLRAVNISSPEARLRQYPHEMSGGMLQRIVAAAAIACRPALLIADEPTTALDPGVQVQFLDLLDELRTRESLSLIIVTHDFGVVARLCDRVMVMYAGRAVETGSARAIFENPRHPYTIALLAAMRSTTDRSQNRLVGIDGAPPDLGKLPPGCAFAPRCSRATSICRQESPPVSETTPAHIVACWEAR